MTMTSKGHGARCPRMRSRTTPSSLPPFLLGITTEAFRAISLPAARWPALRAAPAAVVGTRAPTRSDPVHPTVHCSHAVADAGPREVMAVEGAAAGRPAPSHVLRDGPPGQLHQALPHESGAPMDEVEVGFGLALPVETPLKPVDGETVLVDDVVDRGFRDVHDPPPPLLQAVTEFDLLVGQQRPALSTERRREKPDL